MKIAIALGTRPEIIKLSSIMKECESRCIEYFVIHTGQHYSNTMDEIFFQELGLPNPKYNLYVGSGLHGKQTGKMLGEIEEILLKETPDMLLVQGDTNTTLAGALAASKLGIKIGHVEAGLRSYDRTMPEETNRALIDHISDYLFCPTEAARETSLREGIETGKIFVVGNTIVDAIYQNTKQADKKEPLLDSLGVKKKEYILFTAHRPSNTDDKIDLEQILKGIEMVHNEFGLKIIFPMHPRTEKMLKTYGLSVPLGVETLQPEGFHEFLLLEKNAKLILTDSGGVQEEACILNVPCVTLRENTERPESIDVGANMLAGRNPEKILAYSKEMINKEPKWKNPFGTGHTAKTIIEIITPKAYARLMYNSELQLLDEQTAKFLSSIDKQSIREKLRDDITASMEFAGTYTDGIFFVSGYSCKICRELVVGYPFEKHYIEKHVNKNPKEAIRTLLGAHS